jgi:hypothetical protein
MVSPCQMKVEVKGTLPSTVSRPVCSGVRPKSENLKFFFVLHRNYRQTLAYYLVRGALSDQRTGL